jgi:hypothetical protein
MRSNRVALLLGSLSVFVVSVLPQCAGPQGARRTSDQNVIARYIQAIQKRDFKTVIDLTYSFQQQVQTIKANNPQVLWAKLIGEYYTSKASNLSNQPGFWQRYGETLVGGANNPDQSVRALQDFLPNSCKWKVSESRTDQVQDPMTGALYQRTRVYVTVDYLSPAESAIAGQQRLKEAIIEFDVHAKSQLVMAVSRLSQGDVYWPVPALTNDIAIALLKANADPRSLHPYIKRAEVILPYGRPVWLDQYQPFFEKHGFQVHPFVFDQGARIQVEPPAEWEKFRLTIPEEPPNSVALYQLDNSAVFDVTSLQQQGASAVAKVRVTADGCNPVCTMVREYWALGWNDKFPYRGNYFFFTHWESGEQEKENQGGFPAYMERSVNYQWDAAKMAWRLGPMATIGQGPLISK